MIAIVITAFITKPSQFFPSPVNPRGQDSHNIVLVFWIQRTPGKHDVSLQFRMITSQCWPAKPALHWQV